MKKYIFIILCFFVLLFNVLTLSVYSSEDRIIINSDKTVSIIDGNGVAVPAGVPSGVILMWHGSVATIPSGWYLCDGNNSTPNLTDRFIMAAGGTYSVDATGDGTIPSHYHTMPAHYPADPVGGGHYAVATGSTSSVNTGSYGTGTKVIATYYALAYIMKG